MSGGLAGLFAAGAIADAVLAVLVLESFALSWLHRRGTIATPVVAILPNLAAGACLVLALRGALVGASWPWIAAAMAGAGLAHAADLASFVRRRDATRPT